MGIRLEIAAEAAGWETLSGTEETIRRALQAASDDFGHLNAAFSVLLTGDEEMRALNKQWRGFDKPTNVLSFPAPQTVAGEEEFFGDIALAYETVMREANEEMKQPLHHVSHLAVHGALHLFGLDHQNDEQAETMEARERKILATLGVPDPYADGRRLETA